MTKIFLEKMTGVEKENILYENLVVQCFFSCLKKMV